MRSKIKFTVTPLTAQKICGLLLQEHLFPAADDQESPWPITDQLKVPASSYSPPASPPPPPKRTLRGPEISQSGGEQRKNKKKKQLLSGSSCRCSVKSLTLNADSGTWAHLFSFMFCIFRRCNCSMTHPPLWWEGLSHVYFWAVWLTCCDGPRSGLPAARRGAVIPRTC